MSFRRNIRGGFRRPATTGSRPTLSGPAVYLIFGQSNAMGDTTALSSPPALPRSDVRCSVYVGAVIDGTSPRDLDEFTYKGVEVGLGTAVADAGRRLAISKWAYNATSIQTNWTPWTGDSPGTTTSGLLSDAILQTRTFIDQLVAEDPSRQPYVAGAYWNQWESDASGSLSAQYVYMLRSVIARIRAEFHPNLPVYIGKISDSFAGSDVTYPPANRANIDAAHVSVAADSPYTFLVDTDGLPMEVDGVHYTSDGHYTLGSTTLATAVLASSLPSYTGDDLTRVTFYTSRALAEAVGTALVSPCDDRVWAVADPSGAHFVPTAQWLPASDTKAARWFPNSLTLSSGNAIGATILNADMPAAINTGQWYIRVKPEWLSTSETTTRRILYKSTSYSIYYLGSTKQFNVRMNAVDALSSATTFNGTTDEFVIAIDFTNTTDNISFYKNGTLINTVSQANDFSGSTTIMYVGSVAHATANQWIGTIYEPVAGAYNP